METTCCLKRRLARRVFWDIKIAISAPTNEGTCCSLHQFKLQCACWRVCRFSGSNAVINRQRTSNGPLLRVFSRSRCTLSRNIARTSLHPLPSVPDLGLCLTNAVVKPCCWYWCVNFFHTHNYPQFVQQMIYACTDYITPLNRCIYSVITPDISVKLRSAPKNRKDYFSIKI